MPTRQRVNSADIDVVHFDTGVDFTATPSVNCPNCAREVRFGSIVMVRLFNDKEPMDVGPRSMTKKCKGCKTIVHLTWRSRRYVTRRAAEFVKLYLLAKSIPVPDHLRPLVPSSD